jgi:uncharacterized surface protein with fasciclin (FAS1) repeats
MFIKPGNLIILFLLLGFFASCEKDRFDLFERPEWLEGKLYTQLTKQPELSEFAKCLKMSGYDTIINISGSFSVFAPSNDAIKEYLTKHGYSSVEDIPKNQLDRIVKFHIVQNSWSLKQLRKLDVYGWIDTRDLNNNKARGFKRETLLRDNPSYYGIDTNEEGEIYVVDSSLTAWHRKVNPDARKFAPFFYKEYFDLYNLSTTDYKFYFDRDISPSDIHFESAKIISNEIFAENGFVYIVDKVAEPLKNTYQLLSEDYESHSYRKFLSMVNNYAHFEYNRDETIKQPGAAQGITVDSIFDLSFPELLFDLTNEKTSAPGNSLGLPADVTIRYHHGIIAPTDEAIDKFISNYLTGPDNWGSFEETPEQIKKIIVNSYLSAGSIFPSNLESGFINGLSDRVTIDLSSVIQKEFSSNSTFMGVIEPIIPRVFQCVTGPIYQKRGYSTVFQAIEASGLLSALKRENANYLLFVESDKRLAVDSSLIYDKNLNRFSAITFFEGEGAVSEKTNLTNLDLRLLLLNHIAVEIPKGIARKEFIRTLSDNYLIVNNESGEISGTLPTTFGFNGSIPEPNYPVQISQNADNGITYEINNWFSFSTLNIRAKLISSYRSFHDLLVKAGFDDDKSFTYKFLNSNSIYTVFAPTDEAIANSGLNTLSIAELQKALPLHFVRGNIIFTDGKKPEGYYETARIDEKSTPVSTINTNIYIKPGVDHISLVGKDENVYFTINESTSTNIIFSRDLGAGTAVIKNIAAAGVIHGIDQVIQFDLVKTKY